MVKRSLIILTIFLQVLSQEALAADVVVTGTVPNTTVTFSGFAPASSIITIKEDGFTVATTTTNPSGFFSKTVVSTDGTHDYSLSLTDNEGRSTPSTEFNGVTLPPHIDTPINNIHMPATIALSKNTINKGETVLVFGQGAPGSTVHIMINGIEKASSLVTSSQWQFIIDSSHYQIGANNIHSYLTRNGLSDSVNSLTKILTVNPCGRSDLNCDGYVNLTDFSILLYHWNSSNANADINGDGVVSIVDFSIMLFDWTG